MDMIFKLSKQVIKAQNYAEVAQQRSNTSSSAPTDLVDRASFVDHLRKVHIFSGGLKGGGSSKYLLFTLFHASKVSHLFELYTSNNSDSCDSDNSKTPCVSISPPLPLFVSGGV
jgi:hypothetical protein